MMKPAMIITTHNKHSATRSTQQGFTLVEIMIAVTLSLFLISGLVQIYSSNKKSAFVQSELARMQENQRFAVDFLNREIRMAGYYDQSQPTAINPVSKFYLGGNSNIANPSTADGGSNNSDTITIQYESATDCLGNKLDDTKPENLDANGNTLAINTYSVNNETLYCQGNSNPEPQPIAEDIANMQILYGENTDPIVIGETPTANRYVRKADANMGNVVSVRIALLFKTGNPVKNKDDTRTYNLLDAPGITYTDKYRREVVTTTISLRN